MNTSPDAGKATKGGSALRVRSGKGRIPNVAPLCQLASASNGWGFLMFLLMPQFTGGMGKGQGALKCTSR
jgi:hypothetical protein